MDYAYQPFAALGITHGPLTWRTLGWQLKWRTVQAAQS